MITTPKIWQKALTFCPKPFLVKLIDLYLNNFKDLKVTYAYEDENDTDTKN